MVDVKEFTHSVGESFYALVKYDDITEATYFSKYKEIIADGGRDVKWDYAVMPQAEPNGLFMPEGLSATWVMRVNEDGSTEPVYMEETITVSQTKLPKRLCADWSLPADY